MVPVRACVCVHVIGTDSVAPLLKSRHSAQHRVSTWWCAVALSARSFCLAAAGCPQALAQRQVEVLRALLDTPHLQQSATPEEEQFALDKGCQALFSGNATLLTEAKADRVLVPERSVQVLAPQQPTAPGEEAEDSGAEDVHADLGLSGLGLGLGAQPRAQGQVKAEDTGHDAPVFQSVGMRPAELHGDAPKVEGAKAEAKPAIVEDGENGSGVVVIAARQPAAARVGAERAPGVASVGTARAESTSKDNKAAAHAVAPTPAGMRAKRSVCLDGSESAQLSSGVLSEQGSLESSQVNGRQDVVLAVNSKRRRGPGSKTGKQKACKAKVNGEAIGPCPHQEGWGLGLQIPVDDPFRDYAKHVWHEDAAELGWGDSGQFRGWFLERADAHDLLEKGGARDGHARSKMSQK